MLPYILLIVNTLFFSFVAILSRRKENDIVSSKILLLGNSEYVQKNNLAITAFFLTLLVVLAVRDTSIGRDVGTYEFMFHRYADMGLEALFVAEGDVLYVLLNWIVGHVTDNFQVLLVIIAVMTIIPIYRQYETDTRYAFLKVVLFMNMPLFIMLFSGLRQSLAISIGMVAYEYVKRKRPIAFVIATLIAIGFHHSAFILFFLYPVYHCKLQKKSILFIVPVTLLVYIFNKPIFVFLLKVMNIISNVEYEAEITATGAFTMIVLLAAFLAISYIIPDEEVMDDEMLGLRNYLLFALWLQCFAPLHSLAMRFNYYYIVFVPMLIPKVLCCSKVRYKQIAKLLCVVITLYLLYYYSSHTYRACLTGISGLDTYPYVPFWKG